MRGTPAWPGRRDIRDARAKSARHSMELPSVVAIDQDQGRESRAHSEFADHFEVLDRAGQLPARDQGPMPLPAAELYRRCDPAGFRFETTADLEPLDDAPGQARATEAVRFGLGIRRAGYNLFVIGPEGTGKRTIVDQFTRRQAATEPTPPDWIYVNNFNEPHKPRALSLPSGRGAALRQDMRGLVDELRVALPAAFESDDYRSRRQSLDETFKERREQAFREVERHAQERSIGIIRTPVGIALAPMRDGEVIPPEQFHKLQES